MICIIFIDNWLLNMVYSILMISKLKFRFRLVVKVERNSVLLFWWYFFMFFLICFLMICFSDFGWVIVFCDFFLMFFCFLFLCNSFLFILLVLVYYNRV